MHFSHSILCDFFFLYSFSFSVLSQLNTYDVLQSIMNMILSFTKFINAKIPASEFSNNNIDQ